MHLVAKNHAESEGERPLQGAMCTAGGKRAPLGGREERRTLHPGYLLSAREGVVEARDVRHDGLLIRTGSAHNVCEGGGGLVKAVNETTGSNNDRKAVRASLSAAGESSVSLL